MEVNEADFRRRVVLTNNSRLCTNLMSQAGALAVLAVTVENPFWVNDDGNAAHSRRTLAVNTLVAAVRVRKVQNVRAARVLDDVGASVAWGCGEVFGVLRADQYSFSPMSLDVVKDGN